ncbi:MAG TPA: AraC family transcriptional regulator [Lacunisphaera sp.]|nr:AraC family transcriptional regulator [Lacunisphaera sp.]
MILARSTSLSRLVAQLPRPPHPLLGRRPGPLALPDNLICFQRRSSTELNRPGHGRSLHHRFVLIFALRGRVSVCVDDHVIPLGPNEGLLVFPFQFHHYVDAGPRDLTWLFVTFDLAQADGLQALRYRPFPLVPALRALLQQLLAAHRVEDRTSALPLLLLALLLARIARLAPARPPGAPPAPGGLVTKVNEFAHQRREPFRLRELARSLGISQSHLRARFRASCGVSIGRHLRRLRLERACGLLRLTSLRVSEVAEQCGFNSVYSFSRAFGAAYGQAPTRYRQLMRAGPGGRRQ